MKLNGLDHDGNIAWRMFLSPLWSFDLFLIYTVMIGGGLLFLYFVVEFIYENLPSTKRKIILAKENIEHEKRQKELERRYEESRQQEIERLFTESYAKSRIEKMKLEVDQRALQIAQSKTKDEVKNELLNSFKGRGL